MRLTPKEQERLTVFLAAELAQRPMVRNNRLGAVRVAPDGSAVTLDGEPIASKPATEVPLSRRYLLA